MKFTLNITDMNEEEFIRVFQQINTPLDTDIVIKPHVPNMSEEPDMSEVDADGLKWDARIHSSNHKLTAKGIWQRRKGITDDEFNAIKNELLGVAVEPTPVAAPVQLAVENQFAPQVIVPEPTPVVAPTPLAPAPTPQPTVAQPAPQIDSAVLNNTMIEKLKTGLANGTLKANDIQNLINAVNVQFNVQYQSMAQVKDNIPVLQFVIDTLVSRGL